MTVRRGWTVACRDAHGSASGIITVMRAIKRLAAAAENDMAAVIRIWRGASREKSQLS